MKKKLDDCTFPPSYKRNLMTWLGKAVATKEKEEAIRAEKQSKENIFPSREELMEKDPKTINRR